MDKTSVPSSRRRRGGGSLYKQPGCSTWTMKYYRAGKCYRESTGLADYQAARQALNRKLGKIAEGTFTEPRLDRVRVSELMPAFFRQQKLDGCKDWARGERRWKRHLEPFFGWMLGSAVTSDVLNTYMDDRLTAGAGAGTVNREIAVLRGAFRLAAEATPPKVQRLPKFPRLNEEHNVRKGFVDDRQYERLVARNPPLWLRAMLEIGYEYGWRRGELTELRCRQVDLNRRTISLDPGSTKNGDGREVKMTRIVCMLLAQCVAGKGAEDFVFTHEGKSIGDFRKRWRKLCAAAGVPGLLFHDLRRSAVRNLVDAGVSEKVAMGITGHKTRAVFDRYHIVNQRDLEEAARKSEARRNTLRPAEFGHDNGHDSAKQEAAALEKVN